MDWVSHATIQLFFSSWRVPSKNTLIIKLWELILPYLCWGIWKERNDIIFRGVESNPTQVFHKIKVLLHENIKICGKGQQPLNEWDAGVMNNWNIRNMILNTKDPNPRESARWDCRPTNWFKINFDGASKGNPGMAGCGVMIRNSNGDFVGGMAIPLGCQTNHVVEASVALYGLIYAKDLNLKNIWIKGDSLNIIN